MNQLPNTLPLFAGNYQHPPDVFDEFLGPDGVRGHWSFMREVLEDPTAEWASLLNQTVSRLLQENAVTYLADGTRRPWQLDGLPFILDGSEWHQLETGLIQRAWLLNTIVADFYGAQNLLHGQLPSAIAFANPNFLLPSCGYQAADGIYLNLLAFDLGRSPDGQWRVLSNRTEAPSGLGYTLENRMIMARSVPELFERGSIARLARFFREYSENLQQLSGGQRVSDGLTVILSGGPDQSTYFEHTFLGRYLGFPVVEGADLTVRDNQVYLKTLEGLKRIDLISRFIQSIDCDPLELKPRSLLGAPGLLAAASGGNVRVANSIGSGVVENDAIMSFLPGLCQNLLGEDLLLPSLATWWCGQPLERKFVMDHLPDVVIRRAFERKPLLASSVDAYMSGDMEALESDSLVSHIDNAPYDFVGRERIQLSTVPYWSEAGQWESAPMTLRLFVAATAEGYQVMPGGLVRVATPSGDISKDVWLPKAQGDITTTLPVEMIATRRSDRDLPSRTGDDLFWLGRYLERTEGAVRLYRTLFRYISGEGETTEQPVALSILTRLLASMDYMSVQRARRAAGEGRSAVEQELLNILFDPDSDDGLAKVLLNVNRTAEHVRERLSRDAWRLFESLSEIPQQRWRVKTAADVVRLLDDLVEKLSAVNGQIYENMTRGHGWRLLVSGRRLERSRFVIRIIRELCTREPQEPGALALLLDACDSGITHRARYQSNPTLNTVLDLLLVDNSNPRAVIHQVEVLQLHFEAMPNDQSDGGLAESERLLLATQHELILADVDKLVTVVSKAGLRTHLNRLLKRIDQNMITLHQVITRTYFDHTLGQRH